MKSNVQFTLNGRDRSVEADPRRSLLDVLREDLELTGTKYGCGEGQCRACAVLLDGKAVSSCLLRMSDIQGHAVETIEGLSATGAIHSVQEAFVREGAMQCGYCVPGLIMSAAGLLRSNPSPSETEIIEAMNGNLCRCCGYVNILKAVKRAAQTSNAREAQ